MTKSLVLGAGGQDGSYLAEHLVRRGHEVVGVGRAPGAGAHAPAGGYRYRSLDVAAAPALRRLLDAEAPDRVFHFAAVHGSAGFAYEPVWGQALAVNSGALHTVLEYARQCARPVGVVYASSCKVLGDPLKGTLDEDSPRSATCLYTITKLAAEELLKQYRARHGVAGSIVTLFNHESVRRPPDFFFPRLARELARCLADPAHEFAVRTLDFYCDWGAAEEYMDLVCELAERAPGQDTLLASGVTWHGRDFVRGLFARHGLEADRHVRETEGAGACAPVAFQADISRLVRLAGRGPARHPYEVLDELLAGERPEVRHDRAE
ncbi:MAG: GDP-mannose 4,6-dehydratase [Proteobacteria bacterium]|nr:GDP-mannose 4,6-dehydratase [Pseudomonadota bacterium]